MKDITPSPSPPVSSVKLELLGFSLYSLIKSPKREKNGGHLARADQERDC